MDFIQHTVAWVNGELFEAKLILLFGGVIILAAILFYTAGSTPNAKTMLFPLLVTGVLFGALGGGMLYNNTQRLQEYPQAYEADPAGFIQSEKERVEEFSAWYPVIRYLFAGAGIAGFLLFTFWDTPLARAIGVGLILTGLGILTVDHFSEERAKIYHREIIEVLK